MLTTVTDFNEELARATLLERPNSFFLGSAAPEDVDSDSGYSSPQHRQTTAVPSDASAAAAAPVAVRQPPPQVGIPPPPQSASRVLEAARGVQQPAMVTYMPDGRHLPMIYAPYPFQGPPSVNMFLPAAKGSEVRGDTPRPQSANRRRGGCSQGKHRSSGSRKASRQQTVAPTLAINSQSTAANGAVSSQMTACSEPALPFDDVDEFPYLLSAADGLVASQVASSPHPPNLPSTCRPVEVTQVDTFHLPRTVIPKPNGNYSTSETRNRRMQNLHAATL